MIEFRHIKKAFGAKPVLDDERGMYPMRQKCAMVLQHSTLFDSMTCVENVALPLRKHRALQRTIA